MITMTISQHERGPSRSFERLTDAPTLGLEVLARIDGSSEPEVSQTPDDVSDLTEAQAPLDFIGASN